MLDILLANDGDLHISDDGDISLTNSVSQAVKVRLKWFFSEWRFMPEAGIPYFDYLLVKNPDIELVRVAIREEVMSIERVSDVLDTKITVDTARRKAIISLTVITDGETFREEVLLDANLRTDPAWTGH